MGENKMRGSRFCFFAWSAAERATIIFIFYLKKGAQGFPPCAPYKWVVYQPFRPLDATPCTKYFCRERNTISTGISAMTEAAMIRPYSAEYWR